MSKTDASQISQFSNFNASIKVIHWVTELERSAVELLSNLSGVEDVDGVDRFSSFKGTRPLLSDVLVADGCNVVAEVVEIRKGVEDGVGKDNGVGDVDNWSGSEDSEGKGQGVDNRCGVEDGGDEDGVDNLYGVDDVG